MSMLERLSIRGIRNFGVDAEDEQKIAFSTPLTLILGQNGSGKTTIIECIKYALTAEVPPNTEKGLRFINNPNVLHTNESLGQVKMQVKNSKGTSITVSRSAKVVKKNQKLMFKSMDNTITINENGKEPISVSKRIEDATEDMVTAMGVSKAIINHVLFCHQEESNWPLGTDAEVMNIFDQIFGTSDYNRALDTMRSWRKKYELEEKEKRVVLKEMEMSEEIKVLTKELAEQKNKERDLNDNLELKKIQSKINETEKELETLRKHEREVDFAQILEKKTKIAREMEKIIMDRTRLDGQMKEKHGIIASIREEITKPKYRDAARNYKKAFYQRWVIEATIKDLVTYCETLEKALTKFHSDKMEKINSVIRNLWRTIYKGNDIDYIQINTEETKGTAKRRSYTYRVVASKNDTFMDFRGQSSAGQRVLACLIIRIALAETFSGHCGVLALDEPTTNLDRTNIEALCEALNGIVEERQGQNNFMLIVITHDDDFFQALGRVSSYYRVSRDANGKSRTQKLRVA